MVRAFLSYFNGFLVTSPLIADYIKSESRGQASAYATIGNLIGQVFSLVVLVGGTMKMELNEAYTYAAVILCIMSVLLFFLIREPVIKDPKVDKY